jgi:hypothetical protein
LFIVNEPTDRPLIFTRIIPGDFQPDLVGKIWQRSEEEEEFALVEDVPDVAPSNEGVGLPPGFAAEELDTDTPFVAVAPFTALLCSFSELARDASVLCKLWFSALA